MCGPWSWLDSKWLKMNWQLQTGCKGCQQVSLPLPPEPMKRRAFPDKPWKDLAIDFLGPLPSGHYIFVVIDYFSRYFEIKIMTTISTKNTIIELREIFARFGIPETITADNGTPFRMANREFSGFCRQFGIILYNTRASRMDKPKSRWMNSNYFRKDHHFCYLSCRSTIWVFRWNSSLLRYFREAMSTNVIALNK